MTPDFSAIIPVIAATWPPVSVTTHDGWVIPQGDGGGSRVAAARWTGASLTRTSVEGAIAAQAEIGQTPLFILWPDQTQLDSLLDQMGFAMKDPTLAYVALVATLTAPIPPVTAFPTWPPLAIQTEIWAAGGIGPARLAVMDRVAGPKTAILGRVNDRPAATVFVAVHGGIAMLHALEVTPPARRHGLGRHMVHAAANWAQAQGATHLSLLVTRGNAPANGLYTSLGMQVGGYYHYREK